MELKLSNSQYINIRTIIDNLQMEIIKVAISDLKTSQEPNSLQTILGSCIAICLWDPESKIGSLAHALLPSIEFSSKKASNNPKKYVDSLIPLQLSELRSKGVLKKNLVAKLVGGANMFSEVIPDSDNHVGKKNARKAIEILGEHNIPILAKDTGNFFGRNITFNLSNFEITVLKPTGELWKVI